MKSTSYQIITKLIFSKEKDWAITNLNPVSIIKYFENFNIVRVVRAGLVLNPNAVAFSRESRVFHTLIYTK